MVNADGNIEDWLSKIESEMQRSIHDIVRQASVDCLAQDIETFIADQALRSRRPAAPEDEDSEPDDLGEPEPR